MTQTTSSRPPAADVGRATVELDIRGMTCAACAARVARRLNSLPDVVATVNLATNRAACELPSGQHVDVLVDAVRSAGYDAAPVARRSTRDASVGEDQLRSLGRRLVVAAVLLMPLCDASLFFSLEPQFRFAHWQVLVLVLAAPVVTYAAWPIHVGAWRAARHGTCTMDTLVSLGIAASTGWSLAVLATATGRAAEPHGLSVLVHPPSGALYLDVAAGVTTFQLAGRFYEAVVKRRASRALGALAGVGVREATVLDDHGERLVSVDAVRREDLVVVRPGEKVPLDGTVEGGSADVDQRVLTGESLPVAKGPGDPVLAGSLSLTGRLVVRVSAIDGETQLDQVLRMVELAQSERSSAQRVADRVAGIFVPVVMGIAAATMLGWTLAGEGDGRAFSAALAVLIIACPCALGLATPTALFVASGRAAQLGIFLKGYVALETSKAVDVVVLDKTGTLTEGRLEVVEVWSAGGHTDEEVLGLAASVEVASEHPIARAIVEHATRGGLVLAPVTRFRALAGVAATGVVEARRVAVGRMTLATVPGTRVAATAGERSAEGCTVVIVLEDDVPVGGIALADVVRPTSSDAVASLHGEGIACMMLTGDHEGAARRVGDAVGVDEVVAGVLPSDKVEAVRALQQQGRTVAFVGDGINDAAALSTADLGIALGSGTDVAIGSADMVLLRNGLEAVPSAILLARRTLTTIRGNLVWAFVYNVAAIPLAVAGLLNPIVAAGSMALSSSFVVWNSARLRRFQPPTGRSPGADT